MMGRAILVLGSVVCAAALAGCGGSDESSGVNGGAGGGAAAAGGGSGGGAGMVGGGAGGTTSGGAGGTSAGGAGNTSAGGAAGSGAGGAGFWATPYDPAGLPIPADGNHNSGRNCMNCHSFGGDIWLFGGTVYQADGTTPAPHVQVGVLAGGTLYETYSALNGNFWVPRPFGGAVDFTGAEARVRNANGERIMSQSPQPGCNGCHDANNRILEP